MSSKHYQENKQKYIDAAKRWALANPGKHKIIERQSQLKYELRKKKERQEAKIERNKGKIQLAKKTFQEKYSIYLCH